MKKKSYSFVEGVLYVSALPRMRKFVLPTLIVLFAGALIYFKVKETRFANSLVEENISYRNELSLKAGLIKQSESISELEVQIKKTDANKSGSKFQEELNILESALEKYTEHGEESVPAEDLVFIQLLGKKIRFFKEVAVEMQVSNTEKVASLLNSSELRLINENVANTTQVLQLELAELQTNGIPFLEDKAERHNFLTTMIYVSGIIFCLLIWIYLFIKTRQSHESEQKVKASASVKENFLANMSHEIRTPLNAVLGFANILRNTNLDEEQREYVEVIQSSGDNLLSIVNDILDLSKIEAGMLRIDETPFKVADIMSVVEAMLKPRAEEKGLQLIVNIDSDIPEFVSGDAVRLTQILVNLVTNAIKFTEDGGVYLRATAVKRNGEVVTIEFLVRDTGIGIPEEKQAHIFDRFEQAEASTTRRFGGTGLGLSIVKNLVELQKGTIVLFSQQGVGSSFTIELPYKITTDHVIKTELKKTSLNLTNMKTESKILIAEDNPMNQRLIKHLMKNWNFNFDLVFNGSQALEALKKQHYDLVLMDIQMPEMDGYTSTSHIRSELKSRIPIIAMTAHAMEGEREKCIKAGMNDYCSKPINEEKLFEMIQKYLVLKDESSLTQYNIAKEKANEKLAKVIDLNVVDRYSKGDVEFRKELMQEFIDTVPEAIDSLETAIRQGNYSRIKEIAHDMKTTIHVVGLTVLIGHLLQQIERLAVSSSDVNSISTLFSDVKHICMQAVQEANRLVA